jgi:hypothetical protein
VSCCGKPDAYEVDKFEVEGDHYVAIITGDTDDEMTWLEDVSRTIALAKGSAC